MINCEDVSATKTKPSSTCRRLVIVNILFPISKAQEPTEDSSWLRYWALPRLNLQHPCLFLKLSEDGRFFFDASIFKHCRRCQHTCCKRGSHLIWGSLCAMLPTFPSLPQHWLALCIYLYLVFRIGKCPSRPGTGEDMRYPNHDERSEESAGK